MNFSKLLFLFFFLLSIPLFAQDPEPRISRSSVIDDSTKQIYGPLTTRYFYEENIFFSDYISKPIDTLIHDFHQFNFVQRLNYEYQDLGNIATAMSPIFYKLPQQIGVSSGWQGFDPYWDSETVRYYDTKSPFSNLNLVLGGNGRSITNVDYTRNIKPNWNFGFNYRGLFMDNQILRSARGDRNAVSHYYDAFMTYHSKDSAYWALFNFKRMRHTHLENGGVDVEDNFVLEDFFGQFASPVFSDSKNRPESRDLRTNFHLYHQYKLREGLEVYHIADKYRQFFEFENSDKTNTFFDDTIIGGNNVLDWELFKTIRNEVGVKGRVNRLFYNGYWTARNYSMDYKWLDEKEFDIKTKGTEYYVGGRAAFDFSTTTRLSIEAESLLSTNYKAKASFISPWLEATAAAYEYKPTYIQQLYLGGHDAWVNDFSNVQSTQLHALAHLKKSWFTVSAGGTFTTVDNYVFFKEVPQNQVQKVLPRQSANLYTIQSPEARFRLLVLKKISLSGRAVYTQVSSNPEAAFQIPELFLHGQLAFQDVWVHGNFDFQVGLESHWQSAYFANGYDMPTQQFYTQQSFRSNAFPVVDIFFNWKMKRGRIFFKYNNLVQALTKTGYLPTPYYPGQANILDFGFDWIFFD